MFIQEVSCYFRIEFMTFFGTFLRKFSENLAKWKYKMLYKILSVSHVYLASISVFQCCIDLEYMLYYKQQQNIVNRATNVNQYSHIVRN